MNNKKELNLDLAETLSLEPQTVQKIGADAQ